MLLGMALPCYWCPHNKLNEIFDRCVFSMCMRIIFFSLLTTVGVIYFDSQGNLPDEVKKNYRKVHLLECFKPKHLFFSSQSEAQNWFSSVLFNFFSLAILCSVLVFDLCIADKLFPLMAAVTGSLGLGLEHLEISVRWTIVICFQLGERWQHCYASFFVCLLSTHEFKSLKNAVSTGKGNSFLIP